MTTPDPLTLEVHGLRLEAQAWGPADGRRVLALHGWLDNAGSFDRLAPLLEGVRLVALDLPGHGRSDHRPPGAHYHFVDWVVDVVAAADALGWERFTLLGHSMGAGVAPLVAGTLPERIERLVLIEGLGPRSVPPDEAPLRLARSLAGAARPERKAPRVFPNRAAAAARLRQANPTLSEETAELLVVRGAHEVEGGVTWSSDPRLRGTSPVRMTEDHVLAFLGRIACPTLVVRARDGYPADPVTLATRLERVAGARLVELDGGHHLHLERPEPVARAVGSFLAEASPEPEPRVPRSPRPEADVRLVALDVDGVLTTGGLHVGGGGDELKRFDVKDGHGLKLLLRAGLEVALVSGRPSSAVEARARDLGLEHVFLGVRDKEAVLDDLQARLELGAEQVAFMGDDLPDLPALRRVGLPAAPADARPEVRRLARFVTRADGGRGAVRELAEHLLRAQGRAGDLFSSAS